jgi:hypothetical protein
VIDSAFSFDYLNRSVVLGLSWGKRKKVLRLETGGSGETTEGAEISFMFSRRTLLNLHLLSSQVVRVTIKPANLRTLCAVQNLVRKFAMNSSFNESGSGIDRDVDPKFGFDDCGRTWFSGGSLYRTDFEATARNLKHFRVPMRTPYSR